MSKAWDKFTAKEFQEFSFEWGSKALRILKPGAYNLSFSAPKKYHRMACGIEDAGFKIKDMINWVYGQGWSKGLNISLAINDYLGGEIKRGRMIVDPDGQTHDKRKKIGKPLTDYCYGRIIIEEEDLYEKIPTNPQALKWYGWGTGMTPAHEDIAVAQKPYENTYAENVLKWKIGGLNIDACRIGYVPEKETDSRIGTNKTWGGKREASKHTVSLPPIEGMPMYKNKGRWPSNLILTHHPECQFIGIKKVKTSTLLRKHNVKYPKYDNFTTIQNKRILSKDYGKNGYDIVGDWNCHPNCPIRMIDQQSGITGGGTPRHNNQIIRKGFSGNGPYNDLSCGFDVNKCKGLANYGDRGGASRFFYCAKAFKTERNAGCEDLYWKIEKNDFRLISKEIYDTLPEKERTEGNPISTLKPINLMRYLIRLVCPKGGTVLDPFAGSGTTGIACIIEGMNYILIEKREIFAKIVIPKRLEYWKEPSHWKMLKDHPLLPNIQAKINKKQNKSLDLWLR